MTLGRCVVGNKMPVEFDARARRGTIDHSVITRVSNPFTSSVCVWRRGSCDVIPSQVASSLLLNFYVLFCQNFAPCYYSLNFLLVLYVSYVAS